MESIPEFENLLLKPKEENAKVSTLLYKPEEKADFVKYSNTSAEPTREDFVSDASYQEYLNQKAQNDPRRYVGEKPTDIHVAPGKDHSVIYRLPSGIEVIYTGQKTKDKNGEYWAEIECRGQRGWVVANDLRVTNPNPQKTTTVSVKDETENIPVTPSGATNNSSGQTQGTQEQEKPKQETRKVSDGPLNMRSEPGMKTEVIEKLPKGTEVTYTGKITEEKDGHVWAEVTYDGKTGWVAVEYLEEIAEKEPEDEKEDEIRILRGVPTMYDLYFSPDKDKNGEFYFRPAITANSNVSGYEQEDETLPLKIDENVPEGLIVEKQKMNAEDRTEYLNEQIPGWMAQNVKPDNVASDPLINWFKQHGATVRYTGPYCLPINPESLSKISQGFYGKTSHAGSVESWYEEGFGKCGAVDLAAVNGTPVYSVLPGKVVYVDPYENDFHRVTVETQINGETYYLEYLHFHKILTQEGTEIAMGTQIGTVGGWRAKGKTNKKNGGYGYHLDFRVYKFKDEYKFKDNLEDYFSEDTSKNFIDPFELFDFDVQYNYNLSDDDYH